MYNVHRIQCLPKKIFKFFGDFPNCLPILLSTLLHLVFTTVIVRYQVTDIGNIHHMLYLKSCMFERPDEHVIHGILSCMTDVCEVINSWATGVQTNTGWRDGSKIFNGT